MIGALLKKVVGSKNERELKRLQPLVDRINALEPQVSALSDQALAGKTVTIFGDGEQTRDFVFVNDVVQANLLAATVPYNQLAGQALFNVGRGEQSSLNQIVEMLAEVTRRELPAIYAPPREGDIRHSVADISHAQKLLGYQPAVSVVNGLRITLDWFAEMEKKRHG